MRSRVREVISKGGKDDDDDDDDDEGICTARHK